ncbi:hypothetical protein ASD79_00825 [Caulobacter sp. Root655]|uniref:calcium-binding protein n=1 Tax=Caulobacter sp. Root655 TaxID=1736578 RepID=UPI0006FA63EF|nr:hypothetical protein [Caulobacter sp. Root655]KRA65859.1 hypothetical protein ASD79_00825 [Caulobacter sp. Root655]
MSIFNGGSGLDIYYGQGDADTINGQGGDDYLFGGAGGDTISGGDGNDLIYGEAGADIIDGGAGDDRIIADLQPASFDYDRASDILKGGTGADTFAFEFGYQDKPGNLAVYDHIVDFSRAEGDLVSLSFRGMAYRYLAWAGAVTAPGFSLTSGKAFATQALYNGPLGVYTAMGVYTWLNAGVTYLMVDVNANNLLDGPDFVLALDGAPTIDRYALPPNATGPIQVVLLGTAGNDTWTGDAQPNVYYGLAGNDVISGLAGSDSLEGGDGDDQIEGGDDGDLIVGGAGNDTLHGGGGTDTIYAGAQSGEAYDQGSVNAVYGEGGDDTLRGGEGQDLLDGGIGNDTINASWGYLGPSGGDTAYGGEGDDEILTSGSTAYGGAGDDRFILGGGSTLTGGTGADRYTVTLGSDGNIGRYDTITDFNAAEGDRLFVSMNTGYGQTAVLRGALNNPNFSLDYGKAFSSDDYGPGFLQVWTWTSGGFTYLIFDHDGSSTLSSGDSLLRFTGTVALDATAFSPTPFVVTLGGGEGADVFNGTFYGEVFYGLNGDDQLHGADGSDTLYGNNGKDQIWGDGGEDTLYGGQGDDKLYGGANNDILKGGAGADILDGGDGNDRLDTAGYELGATDDPATVNTVYGGAGDDTITGGLTRDFLYGGEGSDSIFGSGELYGEAGADGLSIAYLYTAVGYLGSLADGGAGDDYLTGNLGGDILVGGAGKDTLLAGAGNDELRADLADSVVNGESGDDLILIDGLAPGDAPLAGGLFVYGGSDYSDGNDVIKILTDLSASPLVSISGGAGKDRLDLSAATGAVQVDLRLTGAQQTGMGALKLNSIENVTAGDFGATLIGDDGDNVLVGGAGNDVLRGLGGSNSLVGGAGDDRLYGGSNGEALTGGAGNDIVDGGGGGDIYFFGLGSGPITLDLTITGPQDTGEGLDTFTNIFQFDGSDSSDVFRGDDNVNVFYTFNGDDQLYGLGGNDALIAGWGDDHLHGGLGDDNLYGQQGNDTIDGGRGLDTAMIDGLRADYVITTVDGVTTVIGGGFTDTLTNVEYVGFNDQTVYIPPLSLTVTASAAGGLLEGADGADVLIGGVGDDIFDGGVGSDTIAFDNAANGVVVDLGLIGAQDTGAGHDTFIGIENLKGGAFSDLLIGDGGANGLLGGEGQDWLKGGGGVDALVGGEGADSVWGEAGDDVLDGGAGNDTIDGGAGSDTVTYLLAGSRVEVDLSIVEDQLTRGGGIDTLISIENVTGSNYDDLLTGSNLSNILQGGAGDDVLRGGGGTDILTGGAGDDTFVFGPISGSRLSAAGRITDFSAGDLIDLSGIDADLTQAGDQAFMLNNLYGHAGDLSVTYDAFFDQTYVTLSVDNSGYGAAQLILTGNHAALTASDFLL